MKIKISEKLLKEYIDTDNNLKTVEGGEQEYNNDKTMVNLPNDDVVTSDEVAKNAKAPWWMSLYGSSMGAPYLESVKRTNEELLKNRTGNSRELVDEKHILDLNKAVEVYRIPEVANSIQQCLSIINHCYKTKDKDAYDISIIALKHFLTNLDFTKANENYIKELKSIVNKL